MANQRSETFTRRRAYSKARRKLEQSKKKKGQKGNSGSMKKKKKKKEKGEIKKKVGKKLSKGDISVRFPATEVAFHVEFKIKK